MGPRIRAKFRCLSHKNQYDGLVIVSLKPVMQRGKPSPENQQFWEASPNGECELVFFGKTELALGAYYYIDMTPVPEDKATSWTMRTVSKSDGGYCSIEMGRWRDYNGKAPEPGMLQSGQLKIGTSPKAKAAAEAFGEPGGHWNVEFVFAEPSDETP